jgi:hypothetical protein
MEERTWMRRNEEERTWMRRNEEEMTWMRRNEEERTWMRRVEEQGGRSTRRKEKVEGGEFSVVHVLVLVVHTWPLLVVHTWWPRVVVVHS